MVFVNLSEYETGSLRLLKTKISNLYSPDGIITNKKIEPNIIPDKKITFLKYFIIPI